MTDALKAPFPWFGGKSRCAHLVWERFGDVPNYVEPFFGSGAVLLGRPHAPRTETINDLDCHVANFWRAVQHAPEEVARWADAPINEADLHARHRWLVARTEWRARMMNGADPDYCDAKIAGWWVWGLSMWIGSGWCSKPEWTGRGSACGNSGRGINTHRNLPDLKGSKGIHAKRPNMKRGGHGVHRTAQQVPSLTGFKGVHQARAGSLLDYFQSLADRLRLVRVCCGDWRRVLGPSPTFLIGLTGVFLDPPYSVEAGRDARIYIEDSAGVAQAVREWAVANGPNPLLRIALCGYAGEHQMPDDWECVPWKAVGGYANANSITTTRGNENAHRERIWFSPHCLPPPQSELFNFNARGAIPTKK